MYTRPAGFARASFESCTFDGSRMDGVDLSRCQLADNDFSSASMVGVVLDRAVISGSDFSDCSLHHARLNEVQAARLARVTRWLVGEDEIQTPVQLEEVGRSLNEREP